MILAYGDRTNKETPEVMGNFFVNIIENLILNQVNHTSRNIYKPVLKHIVKFRNRNFANEQNNSKY